MQKITVEITTEINCPREEAFDCLADISCFRDWMPRKGLYRDGAQISGGAAQKGTTYYDRSILGKLKGVVVAFERPKEIEFQQKLRWFGIPVMESRPRYVLEATENGTRLHHTAEVRLFGIFGIFKFPAKKLAWNERNRVVKALKNKLESSPKR